MAVAKKAVARKAAAPRSTASAVPAGPDPMYVRDRALAIARSLFGDGSGGEAVVTASKLVTQAKRIERYLLGTDAGEDA